MILGRPAIRVEVQRQYWSLIRAGEVPGDAADAVGVSRTVTWRWFRNAGGVMPPVERAPDAARRSVRHSTRTSGTLTSVVASRYPARCRAPGMFCVAERTSQHEIPPTA
jgi:hypothetical protein